MNQIYVSYAPYTQILKVMSYNIFNILGHETILCTINHHKVSFMASFFAQKTLDFLHFWATDIQVVCRLRETFHRGNEFEVGHISVSISIEQI
jgi:hypothetical protein